MQHLIMPLLAAGAMVLSTAPAHADLGDQLFKLLPKDSAAGDSFGRSVAISGPVDIVDLQPDAYAAFSAQLSGQLGGVRRKKREKSWPPASRHP